MICSLCLPSLGCLGYTVDLQEIFIYPVLKSLLSMTVVCHNATIFAKMVNVWRLPSVST